MKNLIPDDDFAGPGGVLVGIDEAGRGALAGPLMMAGCVLAQPLPGLADSKKLSPPEREALYAKLTATPCSSSSGSPDPFAARYLILAYSAAKIDELGLAGCLRGGLVLLREYFGRVFGGRASLLFDGNTNFKVEGIRTMIRADESVAEVSAASILAKVSRDRAMCFLSGQEPRYEFAQHKGYGTARHRELIAKFGPGREHRGSFSLGRK